jgi:very-short-patch-repair endonuclease
MGRPAKVTDVNHAVKLYEKGMTCQEIGDLLGCCDSAVAGALHRAGIALRGYTGKPRRNVDTSVIVSMYAKGIGAKTIAATIGVSAPVVINRLDKAGIALRNRREGMLARMSRSTPQERHRLASAAHDSVRGKSHTEEHRCKIAATRESHGIGISHEERCLATMLADRGLHFIKQKAAGRYNIDIAIDEGSVAVEVFGGYWHARGDHAARHRKRCEYLLSRGWQVVCVWISADYPVSAGCADYIVAFAQALRSGEAERGEEKMITGDGQPSTIGEGYLDGRPGVARPVGRDNSTGRYKPRPR